MNIYVSNLSFSIQDEDLRALFTPYGEVTAAKIISDKFTGKSKGFGFVDMTDDQAGQQAITELDNRTVEGRTIRVAQAKPREERSPRSNSPFRSDYSSFEKS